MFLPSQAQTNSGQRGNLPRSSFRSVLRKLPPLPSPSRVGSQGAARTWRTRKVGVSKSVCSTGPMASVHPSVASANLDRAATASRQNTSRRKLLLIANFYVQ